MKFLKALYDASSRLKDDREVVLAALQGGHFPSYHLNEFVSSRLINDHNFILAVVERGVNAFALFS